MRYVNEWTDEWLRRRKGMDLPGEMGCLDFVYVCIRRLRKVMVVEGGEGGKGCKMS